MKQELRHTSPFLKAVVGRGLLTSSRAPTIQSRRGHQCGVSKGSALRLRLTGSVVQYIFTSPKHFKARALTLLDAHCRHHAHTIYSIHKHIFFLASVWVFVPAGNWFCLLLQVCFVVNLEIVLLLACLFVCWAGCYKSLW